MRLKKTGEMYAIEQLQPTNPPTGQAGFKLQYTQPESVRKQLLRTSLQNNWNIFFANGKQQPEEVFRP